VQLHPTSTTLAATPRCTTASVSFAAFSIGTKGIQRTAQPPCHTATGARRRFLDSVGAYPSDGPGSGETVAARLTGIAERTPERAGDSLDFTNFSTELYGNQMPRCWLRN